MEHWVGWEELKRGVEQQFAAVDSVRAAVSGQIIKIDPSGNVAWFAEFVDWDLSAGGQTMHLGGYRFTGVLEKRDGNWVAYWPQLAPPVGR